MQWFDQYPDDTVAEIVRSTRTFLQKDVEPVIEEYERNAQFPKEIVENMAELGLFGLTIPEEYGGFGQGTLAASLVAREIAYTSGGLHLIWTANSSLAAFPIMYAGSDRQKKTFLPKLATGEMLGSFGLTEPDAGSDAASLKTSARQVGDGWILNGAKTFITNAAHASLCVVFARTGEKKHDISAFLVVAPEGKKLSDIEGVTVRKIQKRVQKTSDFCEVVFEDCLVPKNALLGEEGKGFRIALATLDSGRINIGAQAVGIAARVLDNAFAYTHERKQFERQVWENQGVQFHFADWYAELTAAWMMVEKASCVRDAGEPVTLIASMAKLFSTTTAKRIAFDAAEYFGGMAVALELFELQRALDVFPTPIYEGSSNVQRMVIARELENV